MHVTLFFNEADGYTYTFQRGDQITIGRDPSSRIAIRSSPEVSRKHALIYFSGNDLFVISYGKNGTFLNDGIIRNNEPMIIHENDTIRFSEHGPSIVVKQIAVESEINSEQKKHLDFNRLWKVPFGSRIYFILGSTFVILCFVFISGIIFVKQNETTSRIEKELESLRLKNENVINNLNTQLKTIMEGALRKGSGFQNETADRFPVDLSESVFLIASADSTNNIIRIGTSFPLLRSGILITNYHVVDKARYIYVLYNSGYILCELQNYDSSLDIAILKSPLQTKPLQMKNVTLSDSGMTVFAVGFPWANMTGGSPTITKGVLSGITGDKKYLITDASINKGNSGGPLLDIHGNVIGINTFIIRENQIEGGAFAVKIGFVNNL